MKHFNGIAGIRSGKVKGVCIHNDVGSNAANKAFYINWLRNHNATLGFAHYYVTSTGTLNFELEKYRAWHAGHNQANNDYIAIEICQSKGDLKQFNSNEVVSIKLMAEVLKRHGLKADRTTVRLHKEFAATACPHRSFEIRGKDNNKVKDYYIAEINKILNLPKATPTKPATKKEPIMKNTPKGVTVWDNFVKYKVNSSIGVNVRKGPSTKTKTNISGTLNNGYAISFYGHIVSEGRTWFAYLSDNGHRYIASENLKRA